MSNYRYLDIVRSVRAGEISTTTQASHSNWRANPPPTTPIALARYNIPARLFAGPVVGLAVGGRKRRLRPLAPPAVAVTFDGYVGRTVVFRKKAPRWGAR